MGLEHELLQAAVDFIKKRYPIGWGGAAALYTVEGEVLLSVAPEVTNAASAVCIETGAILEAHKLDTRVTHTLCVVRKDEKSPFVILPPCGICQERLYYWGNVKAAVSDDNGNIVFKTLRELQPYYWFDYHYEV